MNLISRQAVLDGIDKYIEKAQSTGTKDDFISFEELVVKALPSAFEGMTNGEVIKALFPQIEPRVSCWSVEISNDKCYILASKEFWNSPYQKGGEGDK